MSQTPERGPTRVIAQMNAPRQRSFSDIKPAHRKKLRKKMPKRAAALTAAAFLCALTGAAMTSAGREAGKALVSHVSGGFEYDETLGRLQFVSHVLPESAMVFLTSTGEEPAIAAPVSASAEHAWSEQEPWLEYACSGSVSACLGGEVMTIVRNRADAYTVRLLHEDGYESVYSGLCSIDVAEGDTIAAGQTIGQTDGFAAFELRRDGLSIQPVFAAQ